MSRMSYSILPCLLNFVSLESQKTYSSLIADLDQNQEESLKFHIHVQDYFGTLATILQCMGQEDVTLSESENQNHMNTIIDELMVLQDKYSIHKK